MTDEGRRSTALWGAAVIGQVAGRPIDATIDAALMETDVASPATSTPASCTLPLVSLGWSDREGLADDNTRRADLVVGECLGSGGMGEVRLAHQRSLRRNVAVKLLKPGANASLAGLLTSEAMITGFLSHPGVIPVHALGVDDSGRPVLVMKRVDGTSWQALLDDDGHADWDAWEARAGDRLLAHLDILSQVCDAVHFAHSRGVVHRDIKPENVMLGHFGEVYLVDWGIAVRTADPQVKALVGTPAYIAPEMVRGDTVDARTDVYLLGATLHQVLTGRLRHWGKTVAEALDSALESRAVCYDPSVPVALATLCNAATAADPLQRPKSASEFRTTMREYLSHRSSIALSNVSQSRVQKLETLIAANASSAATGSLLQATSLAAEAHFGFSQALDEWAENPTAKVGLVRCTIAEIQIQLLRRDVDSAEILAARLSEIPADLRASIDAVRAEVEQVKAEQVRLEALERDHDGSLGFEARMAALGLVATSVLGIGLVAYSQDGGFSSLTHPQAFAYAIVAAVACAIGVVIKREALFATAFNRQGVGLLGIAVAFVLMNRSVAWISNIPLQYMLIMDSVVLAAVCAAAAVVLLRWMAVISLIFAGQAIAISLAPGDMAATLFTLGDVLTIIAAVLLWRRIQ